MHMDDTVPQVRNMIQMGFDPEKSLRAWKTFKNEEQAIAWLCDNIETIEAEGDAPSAHVTTKRKPKKTKKQLERA